MVYPYRCYKMLSDFRGAAKDTYKAKDQTIYEPDTKEQGHIL